MHPSVAGSTGADILMGEGCSQNLVQPIPEGFSSSQMSSSLAGVMPRGRAGWWAGGGEKGSIGAVLLSFGSWQSPGLLSWAGRCRASLPAWQHEKQGRALTGGRG